jgi:hypothetical protein
MSEWRSYEMNSREERETMISRHLGKVASAGLSLMAVFAVLAPTALATTPNPGYGQFAGCPNPKTETLGKGVEICLVNKVTSGNFKMGNKNVPIENPIVVSGGTNVELEHFVFNSHGGMPPVKQKVPGGVIGLTGLTWLAELFGSEALTLYAATELAGPVEIHGFKGITLPIKVHLINGTLGNNCYVGPINLNLTTGTTSPPLPNKPISGHEYEEFSFNEATEISFLNRGKYVDNSFSAPSASGCVLTVFGFIPISINGLVNSEAGLPAAAGNNETIQNINSELAEPSRVYP